MQTIQIVLDASLLKEADLEAKRQNLNRSALIRQALQEHLKRLRDQEFEAQERRAYLMQPQRNEEFLPWEEIAAWPEN